MTEIFAELATWAWLVWALACVTFLGGTLTLMLFLYSVRARRYSYALVASGFIYVIVFGLVGMQAGERPFVPPAALLPWARLLLLIASVVGLWALTLYWLRLARRCP